MATGVLPILFGSATKVQSILPDTDKEYIADFQLGVITDTLDNTGTVLERKPVLVSAEDVENVLPLFVGDILQTPPMYSAVRVDGKRLYQLARQGITGAESVCCSVRITVFGTSHVAPALLFSLNALEYTFFNDCDMIILIYITSFLTLVFSLFISEYAFTEGLLQHHISGVFLVG